MEYVVKQSKHTRGNAGLAERGDGGFDQPGAETGGGHDNAGGTSHRDDEVDGDHVAEAVGDELHELALVLETDDADDDAHEQEPGGGVIEPPVAEAGAGEPGGGARESVVHGFAQAAPGDEAEDHHDEGESEQPQHGLLAAGELRGGDVLAAVSLLALVELRGGEDGALVGADLRIRGDEQHGEKVGGEPENDADDIGGAHVHFDTDRGRGSDGGAGRERVDGGAENAGAGAEQDGGRADDRVKAGGHHRGGEQDVEANGLFAHAVGRAADREQEHEDPNEHELFCRAACGRACGCRFQERRWRSRWQRNAPRQNTNVITSEASAKPLTGPIKMSLAEAPTTSAISPFSPV